MDVLQAFCNGLCLMLCSVSDVSSLRPLISCNDLALSGLLTSLLFVWYSVFRTTSRVGEGSELEGSEVYTETGARMPRRECEMRRDPRKSATGEGGKGEGEGVRQLRILIAENLGTPVILVGDEPKMVFGCFLVVPM